jgi:putative ABC transport system substrate-binding protein
MGHSRSLVALGLLVILAMPSDMEAQQAGKVYRVGYLSPAAAHNPIDEIFDRSLKDLGYVEDQNLHLERRYTAGRMDQLAGAANDLVRLNVDMIVVWSPAGTAAVKAATSIIPVVFLAGGAAIESGLVQSLPRPGANVTGITFNVRRSLTPKHLEMLRDLIPNISRVVLLRVPLEDPPDEAGDAAEAAKSLGIHLEIIPLGGPEDLKAALASLAKRKPQAFVVTPSGLLYSHRQEVLEFAAKNRLPAVYGLRELVPEGGLMSLSPSLAEIASRGAFYVDRILKGAKPADLPVEQPTKFELVINLKTAKALGLTIPPSVLLRADEIIQ